MLVAIAVARRKLARLVDAAIMQVAFSHAPSAANKHGEQR